MNTARLALVIVVCSHLSGCTGGGAGLAPVASSGAAIIGGGADPAHPAVGALRHVGGDTFCSGTLIGPDTFLTARHCLESTSLDDLEVFFGSSIAGGGESVAVTRAFIATTQTMLCEHDVALLRLATSSATAPIAWRPVPATASGSAATVVGFGATSADGLGQGTKKIGQGFVDHVDSCLLYYRSDATNGLTCYGDSGGPVLLTLDGVESVVGATSFGDSQCTWSAFARVDADEALMDGVLADQDPPPAAISAHFQLLDGSAVPNGATTLVVSAHSPAGIASITLRVDGGVGQRSTGLRDSDERSFFTLLTPGTHRITASVQAWDGARFDLAPITITATMEAVPPPGDTSGMPCTTSDDCGTGFCYVTGGTRGICSRVCDAGSPCGQGTSCQPALDTNLCLPAKSDANGAHGCSMAGSRAPDAGRWSSLLLWALVLAAWRRRRRLSTR